MRGNRLLVLSLMVLAACTSNSRAVSGLQRSLSPQPPSKPVPTPDLAAFLPKNYVVQKTLTASLDGSGNPQVAVDSVGPADAQTGLHPSDLQLLAWDPVVRRWDQVFDAAKQQLPGGSSPILTSGSQVSDLQLAQLLPNSQRQVVFTTYWNGGASPGVSGLGVLAYQSGAAEITYWWSGTGAISFTLTRGPLGQQISASADLRTLVDPNCCPIRQYNFVVGITEGGLSVVADNRPWLGAFVLGSDGAAYVVGTAAGSPARRALQWGDRLIRVEQAGPTHQVSGPGVVDQIALHQAGDRIVLDVERNARMVKLPMTLASMADPNAPGVPPEPSFMGVTVVNPPAGWPPGAFIVGVAPNTPADTAGLPVGIDLVGIDQLSVTSPTQLELDLFRYAPGQTVVVQYADSSRVSTTSVALAENPSPPIVYVT